MTVKEELFDYAANTYGVEPDYPFSTVPAREIIPLLDMSFAT